MSALAITAMGTADRLMLWRKLQLSPWKHRYRAWRLRPPATYPVAGTVNPNADTLIAKLVEDRRVAKIEWRLHAGGQACIY